MEDITKLVEKQSSIFQQCLLSKDPIAHIGTLPQSKSKNLMLFLLEPHSSDFAETLRTKFSIKGELLKTLDNWKKQAKITNAKNSEEIKYIIDEFLKEDPNAFNYPKPADFSSTTVQGKIEENALPSNLKPVKKLSDWVTEQISKNEDIFRNLSEKAIKAMTEDQLAKLKTTNKQQFLYKTFLKDFPDKFVVQLVKNFYEEMQKTNKNYNIPDQVFFNLSKNQFIKLLEAIPSLINKDQYLQVWFMYNFGEQIQKFTKSDLSISEKDEKRKLFLRVFKELENLNTTKTKELRRKFLRELLLLDISREDVDKAVFLEYIKDSSDSSSYEKPVFKEKKSKSKSKNSSNQNFDIMLPSPSSNTVEDDIIRKSIENLFRNSDPEKLLSELEEFFDIVKLNKIYAEYKITTGNNVQLFENYMTADELKELKEKREITILETNKSKWKTDEEIQLKVRVKNVNNIHVQIYRFDLEKHYNENNSEIDQTQNLSFMQPNHSYYYETNTKNPYQVQIYDIKIEGIPNSRGIWIIELEGEGISSRAFIRKGAVINLKKMNSVGTELKFYDEIGSNITGYSIWMEGKKHNVDTAFTIPYGQTDKNLNLIFVKDDFAERFTVTVPRESYYLHIDYIYNNQSFIVGSKAKILLHPRLKLPFDTEVDVSFKLLEKVKILVTLTNNLGIKSTIDFDNVQFKSTEDYVLQFPIQSYTSQIEIAVSGKIKKYNKTEENISSSHYININLSEGNKNFVDFYLRKREEGYSLFLLGKNGEPISRTEVSIQLSIDGRTNDQTQNLMTSANGQVILGELESVVRVTAKLNSKSGVILREWNISQDDVFYNSSTSVYKEGEKVTLLVQKKEKVQLWRILSDIGVYIENLSEKVSFSEDNKIIIEGLSQGKYVLKLIQSNKSLSLRVIKGKSWENKNKIYDETQGLFYEISPNQERNFLLGEANVRKQDGNVVVEIPVNSTYDISKDQSFRAHLLASNFITPNFIGKFNASSVNQWAQFNTQPFKVKQSKYYNNKKLSEESSYVINRAKENKFIGNNLEKPRIFLKRFQVRDTSQLQEMLDKGENYLNYPSYDKQKQQICFLSCEMDQKSKRKGSKMHGSLSSAVPFVNPLELTTYNNFLSLPSTIVSNQKGNSLQFKVPTGYSYFECLAFSKAKEVSRKYNFQTEDVDKKDLSHTGIEEKTKETAWTMSREVYKAQKGETIKVGRDSVWSAVGLSNIIGFAKIRGFTLEDWVMNWNTYSAEEKIKVYDDKICHQLNTYIKYNDRQFFDEVVKPFISNKTTKTFVDLCLLEDESCLNWTDLSRLQQLNEFEKLLLVHLLVKKGKKEQAQAIANAMEGISKSSKISFQNFKSVFDTVITAKLTEVAQKSSPSILNGIMPRRAPSSNIILMQQQCLIPHCQMMAEQSEQCYDDFCFGDEKQLRCLEERDKFTQPFKQMEKTKQYTETTYSGMKYPNQSKSLVQPSPFWTSAAQHFVNGSGDFLTENFMYLNKAVDFTLASCFLPNQKLLNYGLKTEAENVIVEAQSSFLIFVREVKSLPYERKFGVLINQRFFNPDDRYVYEQDGTKIEKETNEFIFRKPYCIQTLITNTSGTMLELQLLIDIPEGSIPLQSHEMTRIQSINLQPYSTLSFERHFYFPNTGIFELYPANACRGSLVIAKAEQVPKLNVLERETTKKMDTLENVLKSGEKESIIDFLKTKNIFDSKIFDPSSILWMLRDKEFYERVVEVLRNRKFFVPEIWNFGLFHHDLKTFSELQSLENLQTPEVLMTDFPIFEYFPYYSSRAHKFLNENKSTIRNKEFKKTYFSFLFTSLFNNPTALRSRLVFIYYLLLQDRIDQAHNVLSQIEENQKQTYQLQFDYIECFIDMYKGYPSFSKARKLSKKYIEYPIPTWQKIFKDIFNTLKEYDSEQVVEEKKKVEFTTTVINEGSQLRISIPANTLVKVRIYNINLELYYSNFPFSQVKDFCSNIVPNSEHVFEAGLSREEKVQRDETIKDCFIEILSSSEGLKNKKVSSFVWSNPNVKIKVKEDKGFAQVFCNGKRQPGCYVKVYQMKNGQSKFYRDGYTDITGTFKYALADLEGVTEFAILFATDIGGVIQKVKPPSQQAYLS